MSEDILDLPLFPVDTVLFPEMELPLHIFEERYHLMIQECLERDRQFGVVLANSGAESGNLAQVHTVGTSALITQVDLLEDEHLDIMTTGLERFRVLYMLRTEPYMVGRVELVPIANSDSPQISRLVKRIKTLFVRYLRLSNEVLGTMVQIEDVPYDAVSLAYLVAMSLQVSSEEKQELLNASTLLNLLSKESLILSREESLLNRMREVQHNNKGYVHGVSEYLALS